MKRKKKLSHDFLGSEGEVRDAIIFSSIIDVAATLAKAESRAQAFLTSHVS